MNLKPCEDNHSTRATRFHLFVSLFETGRVDGTQIYSECRSQTTAVYHCRNFTKEFVLLNHVLGLVVRSHPVYESNSRAVPIAVLLNLKGHVRPVE